MTNKVEQMQGYIDLNNCSDAPDDLISSAESIVDELESKEDKTEEDESRLAIAIKFLAMCETTLSETKQGTGDLIQEISLGDMVGEDLGEISVSQQDALDLIRDFFGINEGATQLDIVEKIKEFQKHLGFEETGKIGKATYMEIYTRKLNHDMSSVNNQEGFNQDIKDRIKFALTNPFSSSASLLFLLSKLNILRENYGELENNKSFFTELENIMASAPAFLLKSPEGEELLSTLNEVDEQAHDQEEDCEDDDSPSGVIARLLSGDFEALKDPRLIGIGVLLFIFGAFGSSSAATNSVWKRIGWVAGAIALGGPEAASDLFDKVREGVPTGVQRGREWVQSLISRYETPSWISSLPESASNGADSLRTSVLDSYRRVVGDLAEKNELLKQSSPEKYIQNFELVSKSVNEDTVLSEKKISDLEAVNSDANSIRALLSSPTQQRLFPADLNPTELEQRKKDLVNYVALLLAKRDNQDIFVKDLLLDDGLNWNFIKSRLLETNRGYIEDASSNDKIKGFIGSISDSNVKEDIIELLVNIAFIEPGNNRDSYNKLDTYLSTNSSIEASDIAQIENIKSVFMDQIIMDDAISEIEEINLANPRFETDNLDSIGAKITSLEAIKARFEANPDKSAGLDDTRFNDKYNEKRLILIRAGAALESTPGVYSSQIQDLETQVSNREKTQKVEFIEDGLTQLPPEGSELSVLLDYLKLNKNLFFEAISLQNEFKDATSGSLEHGLKARLEAVLEKLKSVYLMVKAKSDETISKISNLKQRVDNTSLDGVSVSSYGTIRDSISGYNSELESLRESIHGGVWTSLIRFFTNSNNETNIFVVTENVLEELNSSYSLGAESMQSSLDSLEQAIKDKESALWSQIDLTISLNEDVDLLSREGITEVQNFINRVKEINGLLPISFMADNVDKTNLNRLKQEVLKIISMYVEAINSETDQRKIAQLLDSYNENVESGLGAIDGFRLLGISNSTVENTFEERINKLKFDEILAQKASEHQQLLIDTGAKSYFDNFSDIAFVKRISSNLGASSTIGQVLESFEVIGGYPIDQHENQAEKRAISQAGEVHSKLNESLQDLIK